MEHKTLLEQHGLSDDLQPVSSFVNRVQVGQRYVVRIGEGNHTREAQIALHALAHGIRTAKPLFWGQNYSILERVEGESATLDVPSEVWAELLSDLRILHQHPFKPLEPTMRDWTGDPALIETDFAKQLTPTELARCQKMFASYSSQHMVFGHGDAWRNNILVRDNQYLALIDWGNAGWLPLERELSWLEPPALELALEMFDVDLWCLAARKLELLLFIGSANRIEIGVVQAWLERVVTEFGV